MNSPYKTYLGGKGSAGTFQQIVNLIPPCNMLVIPFLGNCALTRNIKLPDTVILNDLNMKVFKKWDAENAKQYKFDLSCMDAIEFLEKYSSCFKGRVVVYCDPPYLYETRSQKSTRYDVDSGAKEYHERLINKLLSLDACILISCYDNPLYKELLSNWNTKRFRTGTRGGSRIETIYYNFNNPECYLQDYRYVGNDFRDRERIKKKVSRTLSSFVTMSSKDRNSIYHSLLETDQLNNFINSRDPLTNSGDAISDSSSSTTNHDAGGSAITNNGDRSGIKIITNKGLSNK